MADPNFTTVESSLESKLKRIFDMKFISFDSPGETLEEDKLFISIETPMSKVVAKRHVARVEGECKIYCRASDAPVGYFNKKIGKASADDIKDFFFFEIEATQRIAHDIVEKSIRFVYFFSGQYDPEIGSLEADNITFTCEATL